MFVAMVTTEYIYQFHQTFKTNLYSFYSMYLIFFNFGSKLYASTALCFHFKLNASTALHFIKNSRLPQLYVLILNYDSMAVFILNSTVLRFHSKRYTSTSLRIVSCLRTQHYVPSQALT